MNVPLININSPQHCPALEAEAAIPFGCAKREPSVGEISVSPSVSRLLRLCEPTHISGLVVSGWVNSIKRVIRAWSWSNVSKESVERVVPFWKHSYATCAIIGVRIVLWVIAACSHIRPRAIFWGSRATSRVTMFGKRVKHHFHAEASAGLSVTIAQFVAEYDGFVSAITSAAPLGLAILPYDLDGDQFSETLAGNVNNSVWHTPHHYSLPVTVNPVFT